MKGLIQFPDPSKDYQDGLVAYGGNLEVETLVTAYSQGIFPWPQGAHELLWFCPDPRGVLFFSELHIPQKLKKLERQSGDLIFTVNRDFAKVVDECQRLPRKGQAGTWITENMKSAYVQLHRKGFALSFECHRDAELVGGLYGVYLPGYFSGESMFHKVPNIGKLTLLFAIRHLQSLGLTWMDTQMVTPVLAALGARYISKSTFLQMVPGS